MKTEAIETYADLAKLLQGLSPEELTQPIQIVPPSPYCDATVALQPAIWIGPVSEMDQPTRSAHNNTRKPDSIVIGVDWNPFHEDGSIGEDLVTGERVFPR